MPSAEELKILGEKTAISLMKEMHFLGKLKQDPNLGELLDGIPQRDKLDFQTIAGEDAAKSDLAKGSFGLELMGLRFCIVDGNVERINMMDIDHTVPFKYIQNKQKALLNHLNDSNNVDFTEGFLRATAVIGENTVNISDYFGRDPSANVIKGTRRFFRLCYNDIDNLLLLCHACNVEKGAKDSLEWFQKQEPFLGAAFIEAVTVAGGLHDGIIVKKICNVAADNSDIIQIGAFSCRLHDGKCTGLGEFVNDWFKDRNPEYGAGIVDAYKEIWLAVKEIWELQLTAKAHEDQKSSKDQQVASNKLTLMLKAHINAVEEHYKLPTKQQDAAQSSQPSDSSIDSVEARQARIKAVDEDLKKMLRYTHNVKKIQRLIAARSPALATPTNRDQLYKYLEDLNIRGQTLEQQERIFKTIPEKLEIAYASTNPEALTVDSIKRIIEQAVVEENPWYQRAISAEAQLVRLQEAAAASANPDVRAWVDTQLQSVTPIASGPQMLFTAAAQDFTNRSRSVSPDVGGNGSSASSSNQSLQQLTATATHAAKRSPSPSSDSNPPAPKRPSPPPG